MTEDDTIMDEGGGEIAGLTSYLSDSRGRKAAAQAADTAPLPGKVGSPSATGNEPQMVDVLLQAYHQMLDVPPRISRKSCAGIWDAARRLVKVARPVDTVSRTSGRTEAGHTILQPEEWLLHFQHGVLSISTDSENDSEQVFSDRDAWRTAVGDASLDLNSFRVYAFLRRLGYIIVCPVRDAPSGDSLPCTEKNPKLQGQAPGQSVVLGKASLYAYDDVLRLAKARAPTVAMAANDNKNHATKHKIYNMYKPDSHYKKRNPGPPHFKVIVNE